MRGAIACLAVLTGVACSSSDGGPPGGDGVLCGAIRCQVGYVCADGSCIPGNTCEGVDCDDGTTCSHGVCEPLGTDGDGDGIAIEDDCDDANPRVGHEMQVECSSECGSGIQTCTDGHWSACNAPTDCHPGLDAGVDSGVDAAPEPGPDSGPDAGPGPCEICDPGYHVAQANTEPCDCPEVWRVVFVEDFETSASQVCRDGLWTIYNLDPRDPAACCTGDFRGCEQ